MIGWSGTSSGWLGFDADLRLCERIRERTGIAATTAVLALNELLALRGVKRLAFVTPYTGDVQARIIGNYRTLGIEVVAERHLGIRVNHDFAAVEPADDFCELMREVAQARAAGHHHLLHQPAGRALGAAGGARAGHSLARHRQHHGLGHAAQRRAARPAAYSRAGESCSNGTDPPPDRSCMLSRVPIPSTPAFRRMPPPSASRAPASSARTSVDDIYERIYVAILEHRLQPGTKLGEEKLADIFGVSRARVREVLARLAHEQIVELDPAARRLRRQAVDGAGA